MTKVWFLIFSLGGTPAFLGGEYQTLQRCEQAAANQMPHWKLKYRGRRVTWECEFGLREDD